MPSGTLLDGKFSRYNFFSAFWPPIGVDLSTFINRSGAYCITRTQEAFLHREDNNGVPSKFGIDLSMRWTLRVRRWRVTAPGWSTASYRFHQWDVDIHSVWTETILNYPARSSPAFDDYYQFGYIAFLENEETGNSWISRFIRDGITELDVLDDLCPPRLLADSEFVFTAVGFAPPTFIAENPILITDRAAWDTGFYYTPIGTSFNINREVVRGTDADPLATTADDGLHLFMSQSINFGGPPPLGEFATDDDMGPFFLGGMGGPGRSALNPYGPTMIRVDDSSFDYLIFMGEQFAYPMGPGQTDPGGHGNWLEKVTDPVGLEPISPDIPTFGKTCWWRARFTADKFWPYSGIYDENTGDQLSNPLL